MPVSLKCGLFTPGGSGTVLPREGAKFKSDVPETIKSVCNGLQNQEVQEIVLGIYQREYYYYDERQISARGSRVRHNRDGDRPDSLRDRLSLRDTKEAVEYVKRFPISDSNKEKIYHLNAERLMRL